MLKELLKKLDGYKTKLAAAGLAIIGLGQLLLGDPTGVYRLFEALGFYGMRDFLSKVFELLKKWDETPEAPTK